MKPRFRLVSALFLPLIFQGLAIASGNNNPTSASFSPTSVTLKAPVGTTTSTTVNLFDLNSPPLAVSSIVLSGVQANEFAISGTCVAGAVVNRSAGPCSLKITFTPQAVGARTAAISATFGNAPSISLAINGQGVSPAPVLNILSTFSDPIDLGSQLVGAVGSIRATTFLQIADSGGSSLTISASVVGPNASDFLLAGITTKGASCVPSIILNSQNLPCNLPISFAPTAVGTRTATLRITSNDPARPVVDIGLTGIGTPGNPPPPPPPPPPIVSAADFSDLWGVVGETNRSIEITHHKSTTDVLKAFWHTYDVDGRDMWLELTDGHWVDSLTYTGNLHRSRGTSFSLPDDPTLATDAVVGTATLKFTDAANGTFSYSVNGTTGSLTITRVVF